MNAPLTVAGLLAAYRSGKTTPFAIAEDVLARIAAYRDEAVWISRVPDRDVLARARDLAGERAENLPLYGIPFAVKDNIDCEGLPTTAACPAFAYRPARNAFAVQRLLDAGAILLGKTNLDQFATGLVGTRSPYGAPRCVFDARYISGGSSSGSAIAVAAGLTAFALGTDTAGSGRVPAAFNNLVGLKPTRGRIGASGVVPACRSLDCVSIFANSAADAAAVLSVAGAYDEADPFARENVPRDIPAAFRFGVLAPGDRQFFTPGYSALYDAAITRLASLGGMPVEIDYAPFAAAAALLYGGAWTAERLAAVEAFLEGHANAMDASVRSIISSAKALSAVDAFRGQYRLAETSRRAEAEWRRMDVLVLPTAPGQFTVDEVMADPIATNARLGRYTNFVNLLDYSAIAVPAGFTDAGLAFGVTLIAPAFCDGALGRLAARLHRAGGAGMGAAREAGIPPADQVP
jgi:allophanate hydrolase